MLVTMALVLGLSSCASYTERTSVALGEFERGDFEAAGARFDERETTGSAFLQGAESGMAALASGNWSVAQDRFYAAADVVEELEDRSIVEPTKLGEQMLSWVVNEGTNTYLGEGYERVTLRAALAMTYLALGDLDGVWVETQRGNQILEAEEQLYETKYAAGGIGHFMSAISFELNEQYDNAYINYERMANKGVGLELAGSALVRIARMLRYDDELPGLIEAHGEPLELPEGAANIVLIAGVGLGPYKTAVTIPVPTGDGLFQWSVPHYEARQQTVSGLELHVPSASVGSSVVENVTEVARKNLDDRMAWLAIKSAARGVFKHQLTRQLEEEAGAAGWVAGTLFTVFTERADLRSWLTVPDTWQAARLFVAPGEHEVSVAAIGGEEVFLGTYQLDPGETMFVLVRTVGPAVYAHALGGLRIDAQAPATEPTP
jgi:hypothetical protein